MYICVYNKSYAASECACKGGMPCQQRATSQVADNVDALVKEKCRIHLFHSLSSCPDVSADT